MTIMAETPATDATQPPAKQSKHARIADAARNHPDPLVRHNIAARRGRVSVSYLKDPYRYTVDGGNSPADGSDYRTPTTDAELAEAADRQLIASAGTGAARIADAARFALRHTPATAPTMGLAELMALEPFRVYRALAQLLDEDYIHSPYTQLADRLLSEDERTDAAARAAMEADEAFPAEQMSLTYRSTAEKIMEALSDDQDEPAQDGYDRPDLTPELVYTPAESDYDEQGRLTVDALEEGDTDAWWDAEITGRRNTFVALAAEMVDMWADEPWLEPDTTLAEADLHAHPRDPINETITTIDTERNTA